MKKCKVILALFQFLTITVFGQNLFFVGEQSFLTAGPIGFLVNSERDEELILHIAKDDKTGFIAISAESLLGAELNNKLILYLIDGTVVVSQKRVASDFVDGHTKAVYSLTNDQLNSLKNSSIHTVRFTISSESDLGFVMNKTATNPGVNTKVIVSKLFSDSGYQYDIQGEQGKQENLEADRLHAENLEIERLRREAENSERFKREEEQHRMNEIMNRTLSALDNAKNTGENTAISEGETGNQGAESGSVDSRNRAAGAGSGNEGISYSLAGRTPMKLPKPEYNYQNAGKIVVEITVDRNGNVTAATAGVKGSNTLDEYLLRVSKAAALQARFDRKPDSPVIQKGTITYHYMLR